MMGSCLSTLLLVAASFTGGVPAGGTRRQGSDRSDPRLQTGVSQAINPTAPAGLGDLVVVFGTTSADQHPELVTASRFWRKVYVCLKVLKYGSVVSPSSKAFPGQPATLFISLLFKMTTDDTKGGRYCKPMGLWSRQAMLPHLV